jgi:hypothetical protein
MQPGVKAIQGELQIVDVAGDLTEVEVDLRKPSTMPAYISSTKAGPPRAAPGGVPTDRLPSATRTVRPRALTSRPPYQPGGIAVRVENWPASQSFRVDMR